MRADLKELAENELAGIMHVNADNPEEMEQARQTARVVLDENGQFIELLPGPGELKNAGLGTYKKQMKAAFRGMLAKLWRKGRDRIFDESNSQAILDTCHALKQDLGRDWKRFYANLLVGENNKGILMHLAEEGDIDESYIEKLAKDTGWIFSRHPLPIYEAEIIQATKQAFAKEGGLYRIVVEIRPDEFKTFFAKKHGKKEEYLRTLAVQPLLAEITDKVNPIISKDSYNEITVEKYVHGETLTQLFKRSFPKSESLQYIKDPIERAKEEKLEQDYHDRGKKKYLIAALDELVEISEAVERNKKEFDFLQERALGKGGKTFTAWFKEKYKPKDDKLITLVQKDITRYMDEEDLVFCHGDAHTDNVIEQLHQPHWIDWEYAGFSIPQLDLAKFLKKTGLSKEIEEEIVRHVWKKRKYKDYGRFRNAYYKTKILDDLMSAAKYHKLSLDSRKHRAEKQAQADIYFTDALNLIEEDATIERKERDALVSALEKDAKGRLNRLAEEEYRKISAELDPYRSPSIENVGTPSIMEKYSLPPLGERLGKLWRKHRWKAVAGIALAAAGAAGYFVNGEIKADELRQATKIERTSKYYADTEKNEKLMPFVGKYAAKYGNVNADELAAVINAAYQHNKRNADALLDYRQNPEPWAHDAGVQMKKEAGKLKSGLSVEQSFVKEENLEDPENNVFAAAKRLSEMKKEFKNIEDAILAFFTSPEFVRKWKKGRSYWDYSKDKEFDWDTSYKHCYKTLTDMVLAYLKK